MTNRALRRVGADEFKAALQAKQELSDLVVCKTLGAEIKAEGDSRIVQFTISTPDVDRDNDTINVNGWDLGNFTKGGVVLWAHDASQLPVAKPLSTWVEQGALKSRAEFPTRDLYPFGATVYEMLKAGYLKSTSVGFMPQEWTYDESRGGLNFAKAELLEYSVVPVPSNPNALLEARSKGIDLTPMVEWASKILDNEKGLTLVVPREQAETIYARARDGSVLSVAFSWLDAATSPQNKNTDSPADEAHPVSNDSPAEARAEDVMAETLAPSDDYAAFELSVQDVREKLGRVLSSKNEDRLREAQKLLNDVLSQLPTDVVEESAKAADPDEEKPIAVEEPPAENEELELDFEVEPDDGFDIDVTELRSIIRDAANGAFVFISRRQSGALG